MDPVNMGSKKKTVLKYTPILLFVNKTQMTEGNRESAISVDSFHDRTDCYYIFSDVSHR